MKFLLLYICFTFLILPDSFSNTDTIILEGNKFNVSIDYKHLAINILLKTGENLQISKTDNSYTSIIEKQTNTEAVINYPELGKRISINLENESLSVKVGSEKNDSFQWPKITGFNALTIPFHQGKYIPANDSVWVNYLNGRSYTGLEDLSMQFFATIKGNHSVVYMIDNKFNNELLFNKVQDGLMLTFEHAFPSTVSKKEYGFTIQITDDSPTSIAKEYQKYVINTVGIKTLEDKAKTNPNIVKLFGAAHFYIWSQEFLAIPNIKWDGLIKYWASQLAQKKNNPTKHIFALFRNDQTGAGTELLNQWDELKNNKFLNLYQKNLILRCLNEVLSSDTFYNQAAWKEIPSDNLYQPFLNDPKQLNEFDQYQLNKQAFYAAYKPYLETINHWGDGVSIDILNDMNKSGIHKAWMGLNEWKPAFINPDFVKTANQMGFLISPYDDYHSIHQPGNESWTTSAFDDPKLYESATVSKKDGSKYSAFLGIGRKFNPTLAFPSVKKRVEGILNHGILFNSWFVDCDGTGEFLDDYTPGRMTSQEDDMNARLARLKWIGQDKQMVVGTEVGNDFCANEIAFAQGMTTPVIEWSDPDMRQNKNSEYYLGDYFSLNGGIPSKFSKEVKIKPLYQYIYLDHRFNLPLFQLVYNNAVITSHHWEWGTLKIPAMVKEREMEEILYNVPPLYHIDRNDWAKNKTTIIKHVNEFSRIHEKAVLLEMLSFEYLNENRELQISRFGKGGQVEMEILANFSDLPFKWHDSNLPPKSLLINDLKTGVSQIYTP